MFGRFVHFLKYNNAVPLGLGILFLGATGALAASPEVRGAVVSSQEQVVSVDNSYIVNVDLSSFVPGIEITGVTEDADNYYIAYNFTTIDLKDYRWQNVTEQRTLTVSKAALNGKDLGLYATDQLSQVSLQDLDRLRKTQDIEKKNGTTPAVVATTYSGLVGKFLNPKEETLPGYSPVIPEPVRPASSGDTPQPAAVADAGGTQTTASSSGGSGDTTPPTISILGNNPATIDKGSSYVDLGAVITDNVNLNLGYSVSVDGRPASTPETISIDTSVAGAHTIQYIAIDQAGNTATATRTVNVIDPNAAATTPTASTDTASTTTTANTTTAPATASTTSATDTTASPADTSTASSTTTTASTDTTASTSPTTAPPTDTSTASSTTTTDTSTSTATATP